MRLLWNSRTDRVSISVSDERTGEQFDLEVDPADAMTAFHHPYSYASRGWIDEVFAA